MPTIALGIGVVIAGLGIGALISAFQNRNTPPFPNASSAPTLAAVTPVPLAAAPSATPRPTPQPTPPPTPRPTPTERPTPTAAPSATAAPAATSAPSASPKAAPSATPERTPTPRPTPTERPTPTATPARTPVPTATPRAPSPSPTPLATLAPTAAPTPVRAAASPAVAVVQRYLGALIAGNETAAYAALGGQVGDRGLELKEEAFIDRETRINSVRPARNDPSGNTIDVEIASSRGTYFATFHVSSGPSGAYIDQHDYIKV